MPNVGELVIARPTYIIQLLLRIHFRVKDNTQVPHSIHWCCINVTKTNSNVFHVDGIMLRCEISIYIYKLKQI